MSPNDANLRRKSFIWHTGLSNRRDLRDRLEGLRLSTHATDQGPAVGVMYVDLDGFKRVNDTLGHHAGDEVLATVAERLTTVLRHDDKAARLGGDEFLVVGVNATPAASAALAQRIIEQLSFPYLLSTGTTATIGASVGIAFANRDDSFELLMKRADSALYEAKQAGKGTFRFSMANPDAARKTFLRLMRASRAAAECRKHRPRDVCRYSHLRMVSATGQIALVRAVAVGPSDLLSQPWAIACKRRTIDFARPGLRMGEIVRSPGLDRQCVAMLAIHTVISKRPGRGPRLSFDPSAVIANTSAFRTRASRPEGIAWLSENLKIPIKTMRFPCWRSSAKVVGRIRCDVNCNLSTNP
ncbi:GGDEF domain-containing protein [Paraburkholderia hospita]|uniref:GGDEF domain-containing protein n=1 Tax=Paraburkholderia hospita TaxID=169430 RepID=UPI003100F403